MCWGGNKWTTLTHCIGWTTQNHQMTLKMFFKSAINGIMHRKVTNWVLSSEKCTKNNKKAEKTSFFQFSRSRSNSVTLKMLPKNPACRNVQKRSLNHFCKYVGLLCSWVFVFLKSILCFGANLTPPGGQTRVMPELAYNGLYPKSDLQLNYEKK